MDVTIRRVSVNDRKGAATGLAAFGHRNEEADVRCAQGLDVTRSNRLDSLDLQTPGCMKRVKFGAMPHYV